ncbi:DNA topology modulation protein [Streptococcus merionis]|uniref:DNA topology modulation protein n=1 Tax=Streptococcus merionis TaxID=400065 RepID=UPI0035148545
MKIAIIGYSGSGKSTLAQKLAQHYQIPKLHLDTLQFLPGWQERPKKLLCQDLARFLDTNDSWVIDGNYSFAHYERRMEEADQIIFLNFNRFNALWRAFKRAIKHRNKTRDSMAAGCPEKFDWEFIRWILWDGRSKQAKTRYHKLSENFPEKVIVLRNQREMNHFLKKVEMI